MKDTELEKLMYEAELRITRKVREAMTPEAWWRMPVWASNNSGNAFMGIGRGVVQVKPGELSPFAWPGGYECYFVTGDGASLCWQCAQTRVDDNIESIVTLRATDNPSWGLEHVQDGREHLDPSESIVAARSMDSQDSCELCDDCGRFVEASGCEVVEDIHGTKVLIHGEYCSYKDMNPSLTDGVWTEVAK